MVNPCIIQWTPVLYGVPLYYMVYPCVIQCTPVLYSVPLYYIVYPCIIQWTPVLYGGPLFYIVDPCYGEPLYYIVDPCYSEPLYSPYNTGETAAERQEMTRAMANRIDDLESMLNTTEAHSMTQLSEVGKDLDIWEMKVGFI